MVLTQPAIDSFSLVLACVGCRAFDGYKTSPDGGWYLPSPFYLYFVVCLRQPVFAVYARVNASAVRGHENVCECVCLVLDVMKEWHCEARGTEPTATIDKTSLPFI
ncbi:unnamed protein product, partial [Ectocarpus sp. 8 AP-2014]